MDEWKAELLKRLNLDPFHEIGPRELVLLFLLSDGRSPVVGEEVIHLCFFLYPYVDTPLSPSIILPRLSEIDRTLEALEAEGLVERRTEFVRGRYASVIRLTERGTAEAKKLQGQVQSSWIILRGMAVRRGVEILGELEALKKTYNGRSPLELLGLLVSKLEAEGDSILWHVRGVDENVKQSIMSLVKQLSKEMKSLVRESYSWV
ncbi:MAG: hypothetical protein QXS92_02340 [Thermofilum sp.]